jgi:hypothetical protein
LYSKSDLGGSKLENSVGLLSDMDGGSLIFEDSFSEEAGTDDLDILFLSEI